MKTISMLPVINDVRFAKVAALFVKVTHRCNLDCAYCYENITGGEDMSLDTFKTIVDKVTESSDKKRIALIFHGGEPTLLPVTWYREAIKYANYKAALSDKEFRYSLQTNLINVSPEQLNAFAELDINLGVNVDGPADLPTPFRKRAQKVIENLNLAKSLGLRIGIILNINQTNYKYFNRIMTWLEEDIQVRLVKANVAYAVGHGSNLKDMQPHEICEAYDAILDYMIATKGTKVVEENMAIELLRFFSAENETNYLNTLCGVQKCGAGKEVLGITTTGNILPCGRFEWSNEDYFLGNLSQELSKVVSDKFYALIDDFHSLSPENWFNCKSCSAKKICSYGCQAFAIRSKSQINVECIPTKLRYEAFKNRQVDFEQTLTGLRRIKKFAPKEYVSEYGDNAGDNPNYADTYSDYHITED